MKRMIYGIAAFAMLLVLSAAAQAQRPRNFVSGVGSDTNPCTRAEPCKTLAQAISVTEVGGQVIVLDSAEYGPGPITIGQSISITAPPGVDAQITSTSGSAIVITASSGALVTLTGLSLVGTGGSTGIAIDSNAVDVLFFSGAITGFATGDIVEEMTNSYQLWVQNSLLTCKGGGTGIAANGGLTVRSSSVAGCTTGIQVNAATTTINDSFIAANGTGITNGAGVSLAIANNLFEANTTGVSVNSTDGGTIYSTLDNEFFRNTTDVSGSLSTLSKK